MSTQQKALWLPEPGGVFEIGTKDVAKPGPGQLLVKVEAAALNPVGHIGCFESIRTSLTLHVQADWKVQAYKYEAMIPLQVRASDVICDLQSFRSHGVRVFTGVPSCVRLRCRRRRPGGW
jgi:hypothetical protein